jgi:hypothetical protein
MLNKNRQNLTIVIPEDIDIQAEIAARMCIKRGSDGSAKPAGFSKKRKVVEEKEAAAEKALHRYEEAASAAKKEEITEESCEAY